MGIINTIVGINNNNGDNIITDTIVNNNSSVNNRMNGDLILYIFFKKTIIK